MWTCDKRHAGTARHRLLIDARTHAALIRWYTGRGDAADEGQSVQMVRSVKQQKRWIACDCIGEVGQPPLLAPAYLEMASTYYLRRLTGHGRPEHHADCPFFRPSFDYQLPPTNNEPKPLRPVEGFLDSLQPLGANLAQRPDETSIPAGAKPRGVPRLARILWTLIEAAGLNSLTPDKVAVQRSILQEFRKLRKGCEGEMLAPKKLLIDHLWTHSRDLLSGKVAERIEASKASWPPDHKPQAYLIVFARSVSRHSIDTVDGAVHVHEEVDQIEIATPVDVEGAIGRADQKAGGPYLVIMAVGEPLEGGPIQPVRAFAQPIISGHYFVPVSRPEERDMFACLRACQARLLREGRGLSIKRPLFDLGTPIGPVRPDYVMRTGERTPRTQIFIQLVDEDADDSQQKKHNQSVTRMASLGYVIEVPLTAAQNGEAIYEAIRNATG